MARFTLPLVLLVTLAALTACGNESGRPLPSYPAGTADENAMSLIGGTLEFDGACLAIASRYTTTPVFFPEDQAIWSEDGSAIYFGGMRMEVGKPVTLAGTFLRKSHAAVLSDCGVDTTWLASSPGPMLH